MSKKIISLITCIILMSAPIAAIPDDATTLKEIMQGLRNGLLDISDGLLTDDFQLIARGAAAIADHPQIPAAQVQLVAEELGVEMAAFKAFDNRVHDVSLEINAAASVLDRDDAVSGYLRIVEACFSCHSAFKDRVAEILNN